MIDVAMNTIDRNVLFIDIVWDIFFPCFYLGVRGSSDKLGLSRKSTVQGKV